MTAEKSVRELLCEPFALSELKFYAVATTKQAQNRKYPEGTKGKVATFADARVYMERFDSVLPGGWQSSYRCIDPADKAVECTISVLIDGQWVARADVGYPNEAKDADNPEKEPWKAAYSDAFKRASVQHGVGRYLYSLQLVKDWLPVDENGKFTETPQLKGSSATRQPAPSSPVAQRTEQAAPNGQGAGSNPAGATTTTSRIDQLGPFKKNGGPDYAKFRNELNGKEIRAAEIALIVEPANPAEGLKGSDFTRWLQENPDKTLLDLEKEIVAAMRERQAVPA